MKGYGKQTVHESVWSTLTWTSTAGGAIADVSQKFYFEEIDYDQFKTEMAAILTSPSLINCPTIYRSEVSKLPSYQPYPIQPRPAAGTIKFNFDIVELPDGTKAYQIRENIQNVELAAKWFMANGYDPTIRGTQRSYNRLREMTAYEYYGSKAIELADSKWWTDEILALMSTLAEIYKHDPLPASKPCSKVDGQTPPAHERCIVAGNLQESIKSRLVLPGFDGYQHVTTLKLSGVGFFDDWQSTITFDCRAADDDECGGISSEGGGGVGGSIGGVGGVSVSPTIDEDYELFVRCGGGINLLDVDSIDGGTVVSINTNKSSVYPVSSNCTANSSQPFTLSIQTTRLAK